MAGTFTYLATDLITGAVLADSIPLTVQSFSMQINGSGTLTGSLALNEDFSLNAPYLNALECRKAVLWVLEGNYPVWAGVVWDWPHMSLQDGTLPISAQTLDSVFSHRLITETIEYAQVDLFQAFIDLVNYGTTKNSPYVSPVSPISGPASPAVAAAAKVARLVLPSGDAAISGVPWTASYTYSDLTQVSSAWSDMAQAGSFEYVFQPGLDASGELAVFVRLGYDQLGRGVGESGYSLAYPGNVIDYGYQRTGSQSSNVIWATAPPNGAQLQWESAYPHGYDLTDLADGYPLMEGTVSWQGSTVTEQSQVDGFADGQAALVTQAMTIPVVNIGGSGKPDLKDIVLGDSAWFSATSPLHPAGANGEPGLQVQVRVSGWTWYPPGPQQSEYGQLTTSGVVYGS